MCCFFLRLSDDELVVIGYFARDPLHLYFDECQKKMKKVNKKVQEEPQAEAAANPRHQEEEKKSDTD